MIDFSNVASMYSDVYTTTANQTASKLQDQLHNADYTTATDKELMDACRQFEAYFIEQMYKGMWKTVPNNDDNTSNYTATMMDYYKDQMMQSMAEQTAKQGNGLGLAQMLYEQMKRNYGITDISGSVEEAGESGNAGTAVVE